MTSKKTKADNPAAKKKIKRTFKLTVIVDRAKKEFSPGMGIGVLGTCEVTFNLTEAQYASPVFAMSLLDQQNLLRDDIIKTGFEEVFAPATGREDSALATTASAVTL